GRSAPGYLVTSYNSVMRLGVNLFSGNGSCSNGSIIKPDDNNGAQVLAAVNGADPQGDTPTGGALDGVKQSGVLADPARDNFVVLATDGIPSDNCGKTDVAKYVTALYTATPPVKTYVIGF